jgi:hypothetical protein
MNFQKVKTAILDRKTSELTEKTPYLLLKEVDEQVRTWRNNLSEQPHFTPAGIDRVDGDDPYVPTLTLDLIFLTDEELEQDYEFVQGRWSTNKVKVIKLKNKFAFL